MNKNIIIHDAGNNAHNVDEHKEKVKDILSLAQSYNAEEIARLRMTTFPRQTVLNSFAKNGKKYGPSEGDAIVQGKGSEAELVMESDTPEWCEYFENLDGFTQPDGETVKPYWDEDGSIYPVGRYENAGEVNFPVMSGNAGLRYQFRILQELKEYYGAVVSLKCSFHEHNDLRNIIKGYGKPGWCDKVAKFLLCLVCAGRRYEPAFWGIGGSNQRNQTHYCKSWENEDILKLARLVRDGLGQYSQSEGILKIADCQSRRTCGVNIRAILKSAMTVELRYGAAGYVLPNQSTGDIDPYLATGTSWMNLALIRTALAEMSKPVSELRISHKCLSATQTFSRFLLHTGRSALYSFVEHRANPILDAFEIAMAHADAAGLPTNRHFPCQRKSDPARIVLPS